MFVHEQYCAVLVLVMQVLVASGMEGVTGRGPGLHDAAARVPWGGLGLDDWVSPQRLQELQQLL